MGQNIELRSDMTVELVKKNADDSDVLFAARVSTGAGTRVAEEAGLSAKDKGLINYLMRDRHGSPFEHSTFTFYIEAPIFVAREFFRHRAGWSYNEESGRYKTLEPVFYVPAPERPLVQVGKPGAYTFVPGNEFQQGLVADYFFRTYDSAYEAYEWMLRQGIAREVARMVLPVGLYTSFYASCNARSLMHFLSLRILDLRSTVPTFPQREIQMVAEQMEDHFARAMPETLHAFNQNGRVAP